MMNKNFSLIFLVFLLATLQYVIYAIFLTIAERLNKFKKTFIVICIVHMVSFAFSLIIDIPNF